VESIRRGVAPESGIQGRCDGAGSEVDGGRPSNRWWRVLLLNGVYFGEVSERRPWIEKTRRRRAAVAPLSFCLWLWAHSNSCDLAPELPAAFQSGTLFCRSKVLFQLLGWRGVVTGRGFFTGFGFVFFGRRSHSEAAKYRLRKQTAIDSSRRFSTRTSPPRARRGRLCWRSDRPLTRTGSCSHCQLGGFPHGSNWRQIMMLVQRSMSVVRIGRQNAPATGWWHRRSWRLVAVACFLARYSLASVGPNPRYTSCDKIFVALCRISSSIRRFDFRPRNAWITALSPRLFSDLNKRRTCLSVTPNSSAASFCVISLFFAFFNATGQSRSAWVISSCPSSTSPA
jgi:hypothetical protein